MSHSSPPLTSRVPTGYRFPRARLPATVFSILRCGSGNCYSIVVRISHPVTTTGRLPVFWGRFPVEIPQELAPKVPRNLHKVFVNEALASRVSNVQRSYLMPDDLLHLLRFHPWGPLGEFPQGGAPSRVSKRASTGTLVPLKTHAPLSLSGRLSTTSQSFQFMFPLPDPTMNIGSGRGSRPASCPALQLSRGGRACSTTPLTATGK